MNVIVDILKKKDTKEADKIIELFKLNASKKIVFDLPGLNQYLTNYNKPFRNSRTIEMLTNKELLRIFKIKKTLYYFNNEMEISINLEEGVDTSSISNETELITKKINRYSNIK